MIDSGYSKQIINNLLYEAYSKKASDIHLEPHNNLLHIRFRIDGILYDHGIIEQEYKSLVISRIKVLASMDVSENRVPQDGKFSYYYNSDNLIDLRIATFPTLYGEKVVIRILDRSLHALNLVSLGFNKDLIEDLTMCVSKPHGFLLVVGPTGVGKTTTLYALLSLIRSQEKNIMTLEDPIEYSLNGIVQSQVYPEINFSFVHGIRSILRQDPDIIMVGEIRDQETARIALQASLTGHLVLSTLHAQSATSTIMRLLDMGIEPYLLNASLTGVLAQRLIRVLCSECRYEVSLSDYEQVLVQRLSLPIKISYKSFGCDFCNNTGFKGRIVLAELLKVTHSLRALITGAPLFEDIYQQACYEGMIPLVHSGIEKVNDGTIRLSDLFLLLDN